MSNLVSKSLVDLDLAGYGIVSGLLSPTSSGNSNPFVWILSSILTQPEGTYGIWYDNSLWDDNAKWYD
jgi:hypothetical protein